MQVHAKNSRICGTTYNGIDCFDIDAGTSFSVQANAHVVRADANNVCWIDRYGTASCSNVAAPTERVIDIQSQNGVVYSLLSRNNFISQSTLVYNFNSDTYFYNFSVGPIGICLDASFPYAPFCSFTVPLEPLSSFSVPINFGNIYSRFHMHTSTVFWVDFFNTYSGYFGLAGCDGSGEACASISNEVSISMGFDAAKPLNRISLGEQAGYGLDIHGNLKCWGKAVCPSISNAFDVTAYNGGACVEFASSATCFGAFSHTFYFNSFSCELDDVLFPATSDFSFQCAACPLGWRYGNDLGQGTSCTQCPPNSVRERGTNGCFVCPDGYQANENQSKCVLCPTNQFKTGAMLQCVDCGLGSESKNTTGSSCYPCSNGFVRDSSMTSCSLCPSGSVPQYSQTSCFSCPSPSYWLGTWIPDGGTSFTTWTNGTCVDCPQGMYPSGFSCSQCDAPSIRTTQTTCTSCPDGFEPNDERTICFPCTGNYVRTGPTPFCFECPSGTTADEQTRCKKPVKAFLTPSQSALIAFGLLILVASITFRSSLSESKLVAGISMGLFFLVFTFVLPTTQTK